MARTPLVNFRLDTVTATACKERARSEGTTFSEVLAGFARSYAGGRKMPVGRQMLLGGISGCDHPLRARMGNRCLKCGEDL